MTEFACCHRHSRLRGDDHVLSHSEKCSFEAIQCPQKALDCRASLAMTVLLDVPLKVYKSRIENKKYVFYILKIIFVATLFFTFTSNAAFAKNIYPFQSLKKQQQFHYLINRLRCLVCQNENLADSDAKLAADLRQDVYKMVKQGKNNEHIENYMVARYGNFVLFQPPFIRSTYLLWLAPFILISLGLIIGGRVVFQYRKKH